MAEISLLEKKLAEEPIKIPKNPFWEVFKRFGTDEAIAMFINVAGTACMEAFVDSKTLQTVIGPISRRTRDVTLMVTGPVVEKVGFFPAHFKEALDLYRTTPKKARDGLSTYFRKAVKGGAKSLVEDILVHDPLYMGLMYGGLQLYPETPAWMLATSSFVIAVLAVAGLEVGATELAYKHYKRSLKKAGFGHESYFESRFLIRADENPENVLDSVMNEFDIERVRTLEYNDRYFKPKIPHYSGRIPKLRLRHRKRRKGGWMESAQIIYTRTNEISEKQVEQFRYFPQKKDKMYLLLNQEMPGTMDEIENDKSRRILKRAQEGQDYWDIQFSRTVANDPKTLLASTDQVYNVEERPFYVLELKVYKDTKLLKEAMRFVMREFPVVQTTHGKLELAHINDS